MFGLIASPCSLVTDRTVYMEVYGANKVIYRVTESRVRQPGDTLRRAYGIEIEDPRTGEMEFLADFSHDLEDAVDFAEMLIAGKAVPRQLYGRALSYLCIAI
ncbi:MAG: hypothetical protein IIZ18_01200 [Ruminococcus sp.]|nr:hypothetical protein [Ruminococcus sp.]